MRLSLQQTQDLLIAWDSGLESTGTLAKRFPISPQGIRLLLHRHGRDTSHAASRRTLTCSNPQCAKPISVLRMHRRRSLNHYCSAPCYYATIHNPTYIANRHSQRLARQTIRDLGFSLFPHHVVHHQDGNTTNNSLDNLIVFASHSDHMRWHRAGGPFSGVTPLLIVFAVRSGIPASAPLARPLTRAHTAGILANSTSWQPTIICQ